EGALRAADHAAGLSSRLQVVIGEEVSSRDGHIVGLFVERRIRPGMSAAATVDAIHDQGGVAVAVHPFWRTQRRVRNGPVHGVGCRRYGAMGLMRYAAWGLNHERYVAVV